MSLLTAYAVSSTTPAILWRRCLRTAYPVFRVVLFSALFDSIHSGVQVAFIGLIRTACRSAPRRFATLGLDSFFLRPPYLALLVLSTCPRYFQSTCVGLLALRLCLHRSTILTWPATPLLNARQQTAVARLLNRTRFTRWVSEIGEAFSPTSVRLSSLGTFLPNPLCSCLRLWVRVSVDISKNFVEWWWPVGLSTPQIYCGFTNMQTLAKRNFGEPTPLIGIYRANCLIISTQKKVTSKWNLESF